MRATFPDGLASSKRARRRLLGDVFHSSSQRALKALVLVAMAAALLVGRGGSKATMREESGDEAPRAASFARASTASLPAMPMCAGTQCIRSLRVGRERRRRRRRVWKRERRYWPGWGFGLERAKIAG
jgi:hypothetical protein